MHINFSTNKFQQNNQIFGTLIPNLREIAQMDLHAEAKIQNNLQELEQLAEGSKVTFIPKIVQGIKQILVCVESETQSPNAGKNVVAQRAIDVKDGFLQELKTVISSLSVLRVS